VADGVLMSCGYIVVAQGIAGEPFLGILGKKELWRKAESLLRGLKNGKKWLIKGF